MKDVKGFVVILEDDLNESIAEHVIAAIQQIKHVIAVKPIPINVDDAIIEIRLKSELKQKVFDSLKQIFSDSI